MANSKRLGDVGLIIVILSFVVGITSFLFVAFDESVGVNTLIKDNLNNISGTASSTSSSFESDFTASTDGADKLYIDSTQQLDDRFGSSAGTTNAYSKNMFVKFYQKIEETIPDAKFIIAFLISITAVFISILVARVFLGDSRW